MRSKKTGWVLAGVLVAALAVAAPLALSQSTGSPKDGHRGMRSGFFNGRRGMRSMGGWQFRQLNLTDDQKAQMSQIRKNHFDATASVREQIRTTMKQFHDSIQQGTFDEAAASQKLAEIAPLRAKLMADSIKMRQEMLNVLTPDQKAKLDELRQQAQTRRAQHRSRKTPSTSQE
jgi:protein CpxP